MEFGAQQQGPSATTGSRRPLVAGLLVAGLLVATVVAVVALDVASSGKDGDPQADQVARMFNGIPQDGISLGDPKAKLTLVEFADLKCPYCKQFSDNILPTLIDRYVRPGKLRLKFRNVAILDRFTPLPESTNAAELAAAMTLQNKLWNLATLFYLNQQDERRSYVTDEFLRGLAQRIPGADMAKAMADRKNPLARNFTVDASRRFAAIGSPGTPTFMVERAGNKPSKLTSPGLTDPTVWVPVIERLMR